MASAREMAAKKNPKSRSGPNIPEEQRKTEAVKFRLAKGYRARLDAIIEAEGWASRGDLLEAAIETIEEERKAARNWPVQKKMKNS